ncbi:ectoine utilization protein EutC [Qingshengfaniella alkalisoli]|uniref:Ectoine utilization protein EutC n=1 Tax=Qingshengfaniella alkalisoli TaxID=2599296 RepID=A0A5B8IZQ6_9RHOB|nr:ectoine utilization protein EutC [Qingshengfaniella alkalisoli]QDY70098.1 ectoine utilization protein EutC [Qingshengfaniella alkalisoli]
MPEIRILTESELRDLVILDLAAINCVEGAFRSLASGNVVMPPVLSMAIPDHHGEVDVKTAYVPDLPSFAIKVSPGFFNNPQIGLPSTSGLMMLFSTSTGVLESLLLDNGYLTDVRTAAAGAVAARHLSREDAATACVIGAGVQARLQLKALTLVRPIKQAVIWARDPAKAEVMAEDMRADLGLDVVVAAKAETAVAAADIVVTTTPATDPVVLPEWLIPGQHITAMGSDQPGKNELAPGCFQRADLYVSDRLSQTRKMGELRSVIEAGLVSGVEVFPELGDIVAGAAEGRSSPEQITIADLTGTGVQDTAIAIFARARAEAASAGTEFKT